MQALAWLRDHVVEGHVLMPGAAFFEMAALAGKSCLAELGLPS